MKVLIVRYTDQPAVNIVENISLHSKHTCTIQGRNNLNIKRFDVVFYYNVNDVFQPDVYKMLKETQYPICVGVQSWRLIFEPEWIKKIQNLNIIGACSPTHDILNPVSKIINTNIYKVTPFSADKRFFKEIKSIKTEGILHVGYVGTFRTDKCYNIVVKPAFGILKSKIKTIIYGKASGDRLDHTEMYKAYNNMDCLVVGSEYESGPMPPLEAALCGRPTITTRCGMMLNVFESGGAKFIDNNYKSLVDAITFFINNRQACIDMGVSAKDILNNYKSWDNIIKLQDAFFDEVMYGAR